ncbi:MAG: homoserine kinase [Gemmatimonadota bacterium]|nr:homoserine kinase [Gemmatimonadota bacterium]
MNPFRVRVPASASNIGAGFDCLGLALDLWLELDVTEGSGTIRYSGALESIDPAQDIIRTTLDNAGVLSNIAVTVVSEIPLGRGLGSSAAATVAALVAGARAGSEPRGRDQVFEGAVELEGHPDNAAPATFGGLILVAEHPTPLTFHESLSVALAIPETSIETKIARSALPDDYDRHVAVEQARRAAALATGLTNGRGDFIRFGMEDQLAVPYRKDLIPGFQDAVDAGKKAGAYGVTISGSGSTLIAIGPRRTANDAAEAMSEALTAHANAASPLTPKVVETGYTVTDIK